MISLIFILIINNSNVALPADWTPTQYCLF